MSQQLDVTDSYLRVRRYTGRLRCRHGKRTDLAGDSCGCVQGSPPRWRQSRAGGWSVRFPALPLQACTVRPRSGGTGTAASGVCAIATGLSATRPAGQGGNRPANRRGPVWINGFCQMTTARHPTAAGCGGTGLPSAWRCPVDSIRTPVPDIRRDPGPRYVCNPCSSRDLHVQAVLSAGAAGRALFRASDSGAGTTTRTGALTSAADALMAAAGSWHRCGSPVSRHRGNR